MEYELVREIQNLCPNNQMRDIFITEIEADDPQGYVTAYLKGRAIHVSTDWHEDGSCCVYADCDGLIQKFIFTPI